ncbi:PAAR domain-containing protein [Massilia genomosp. 1]|uniref:PAAR domain-containing protein n=1 Tax=Massilia genomosp. 1 TaxID=2609280 RepID=UPI001C9E7B73|nr:PAAR domain-containing protein [Massilia genomosp. 1]
MPRAARLGDAIGHTPPGDGPVGGIGDVTGKIVGPCSSNVYTNGIKAARAYVDVAVCSLHPQAPLPIATGSSTVFINGLPAARVSDKIVCKAYITNGSGNVFIGGAAVQTNAFMPEGIAEEVVEIVKNGATLVLGAGEIVVGGLYNSAVRIGAGLASIPYMLDSVDGAVGVQKEIAQGLNYNFKSEGAKQIGEALKPVGAFVQEKITEARDFSEEHIGIGATAIVFGGAEAGVEIAGVVTGGKALKSFIDFPLSSATRAAGASARAVADEAAALHRIGASSAEATTARVSSRPAWLTRLDEGNAFNAERSIAYPHNEVYINSPKGTGYTRLDSYNPVSGEIVSRKFTQLSEIQPQTGINYVNELTAKYPVNGTIANVPSSGALAGRPLLGQHYLEVPVQLRPIPQSILDAANRAGVVIRDVNGRVH